MKTRTNQLQDLPIYNLKHIVTEAKFYAKISFYALLVKYFGKTCLDALYKSYQIYRARKIQSFINNVMHFVILRVQVYMFKSYLRSEILATALP